MSTKHWWGSERSPRQYAEAILAMDREKQKQFFDEVVPDHLKAITKDHCVTAKRLGGNKG